MVKKFLILFVLMLGFMFVPNVLAKDNIEIKSIELAEKSDDVTIKSEPKFNGLEMDFDMVFKKIGDYAKYKVTVKNDTNINYKISEDTSFNKSSYMTYKYEIEDELKGNSETTIYVTITYTKEVDETKLVNDRYSESNKAVVSLLNEQGKVENPNTGGKELSIIIISIIITLILVALLIGLKGQNKFVSLILIFGLVLMPIMAYAIETLKLTINVNVEIKKSYEVAYVIEYYDGYFTDEELKNMDVSKATCDYTINVKKDSNSTKYTYCSGNIIYKDSKRYYADEKVDLKEIKVRQLSNDDFSLDSDELNEYCIVDSTGKEFNCDSGISEYFSEWNNWGYYEYYSTKYNYPFDATDKDIMKFDEIYWENWEDSKYLNVEVPNTFTMPSHSVLFVKPATQ